MTKARACKGASQEWSLGVTFHGFGSVGECEGMNPQTPKWTPTLRIKIPMDFQIFKGRFQESKNSLDWKIPYTIEKILRCKCLKWARMIYLDTWNINYGQKKGR
jgi:hypothetical protein